MTANLSEGEWLLIHGGGSGIGTAAIQIGRALGARVAVTAGSRAKLDRCAQLGADVLIDYTAAGLRRGHAAGDRRTRAPTSSSTTWAPATSSATSAPSRATAGCSSSGCRAGRGPSSNINALLRKNASVSATSLRGRPDSEKAAICSQVERNVWPWVAAGIVRPVIDRVLPLKDAAYAHQQLADGTVTGKVVLSVS